MVSIEQLIDDAKCYEVVRKLRWPEGVRCPNCNADNIKKIGHHDRYSYRQRYVCQACGQQFDDLSGTIYNKSKHYIWVYRTKMLSALNQSR